MFETTEMYCLRIILFTESHIIGGNRIVNAMIGAHEGGVFSLSMMEDGMLLSGGGKDRKIIQWDNTYNKTGQNAEVRF